MELTTRIDIPKSRAHLTHRHKVLLLGSCFADHIGTLLTRDKFDCLVNPFGTLYNPASICAHLWRCISEREYTADAPEIVDNGDGRGCFSWMHHSSFNAPTADVLAERLNHALRTTARRLCDADWLIVTFGTAYIYRLQSNGMLVANCHKQPDACFQRSRLSAFDIVDQWTPLLQMLHSVNPKLQVIFTVSPIRHKRDGLHANQLSKAELLLALDRLTTDNVSYFPAYELLLDELRDYRFYATDMVHPSDVAVSYIYERFTDTYVARDEQEISRQCRDIHAALAHRVQHPDDPAHQQFINKYIQKITQLQQAHPYIDWSAELAVCHTPSKP
ncbi:MAG: GSCFA domain-containing protein [Prevotellaceae bacterium]|nr:GSCFA domain-containing protein [Prevotellaceae bacterium]